MQIQMLAYARHFKRFYAQIFQPVAAQYGLSQLEIDILLFLYNNPGNNTARDIVEMRGVAKSNVSTAVETLRERGYLTTGTDPSNRRVQRLILLPESRGKLEELAACQKQCFAVLLDGFSEQERAALRDFLKRADENILSALKKLGMEGKER